MSHVSVYITASGRDEALRIGRTLLEERLAACVNVIEPVTSLYWWEGRIQEDAEAVLIAKTRQVLADSLIERVRGLHSYACPGIVCWPIVAGHEAYLRWIDEETQA